MFKPVPVGHRLVVVATNVAETSITIPGIKYVVDAGRAKERVYDQGSGASTFKVMWTSQASANQRSGRAGRLAAGHAYRLFSSAIFTDRMAPFARPEISRLPIDSLILYVKSMGIVDVEQFPFPTALDATVIRKSEAKLLTLGALSVDQRTITPLGKRMSTLPLPASLSKTVAVAALDRNVSTCALKQVLGIAASSSVQSPFLHFNSLEHSDDADEKKQAAHAHSIWRDSSSDMLALLRALGACVHEVEMSRKGSICSSCILLAEYASP